MSRWADGGAVLCGGDMAAGAGAAVEEHAMGEAEINPGTTCAEGTVRMGALTVTVNRARYISSCAIGNASALMIISAAVIDAAQHAAGKHERTQAHHRERVQQ